MIVVKHGRREMQLAWTHLLPATFGGRARMNVQNALAAAAAAFAAGAPLHDIRQGLRTFSTNYYLSPGRLNEVEVNGVNVIVDYCHNAPGMRMLGDFVDRVGDAPGVLARARPGRRGSASSPPPATGATRTCASSAHIAAQHFDVVVVREDVALRGRERGETAGAGRRGRPARRWPRAPAASRSRSCSTRSRPSGTRCRRANPGDLVVRLRRQARRGDGRAGDLVPPGPGRQRRRPTTPPPPTRTTRRRPTAGGLSRCGCSGSTRCPAAASRAPAAPASRSARSGSPPTRTWSWSGSRPRGVIGRHPAAGRQLLAVVSGDATVSGHDGVAVEIGPGQAAVWEPNEPHETRSEHGLTALVVEGDLDIGGLAGAEAAVDAP